MASSSTSSIQSSALQYLVKVMKEKYQFHDISIQQNPLSMQSIVTVNIDGLHCQSFSISDSIMTNPSDFVDEVVKQMDEIKKHHVPQTVKPRPATIGYKLSYNALTTNQSWSLSTLQNTLNGSAFSNVHYLDIRNRAVESLDDIMAFKREADMDNRRAERIIMTPDQMRTIANEPAFLQSVSKSSSGVNSLFGMTVEIEDADRL